MSGPSLNVDGLFGQKPTTPQEYYTLSNYNRPLCEITVLGNTEKIDRVDVKDIDTNALKPETSGVLVKMEGTKSNDANEPDQDPLAEHNENNEEYKSYFAWTINRDQCHICRKTIKDPENLQKHKDAHEKEDEKHKCMYCKKWVFTRWHRNCFMQEIKEKGENCVICGEEVSPSQKVKHQIVKHEVNGFYKCPLCKKERRPRPRRFTDFDKMVRHYKKHLKERKTQEAYYEALNEDDSYILPDINSYLSD